jgi:acetyltransferase
MKLDQRIAHERLTRICFIDYDRELALVAEYTEPHSGERAIMAVGRLRKLRNPEEAELAVLVSDRFQHRRLGTELVRRLLHVARAEQIRQISGMILAENRAMQHICEKLGFRLRRTIDDPTVATAEINLE